MITIDGSEGEGGGQIIRSSLALSMITQKPFTIQNVRGGRKKSGLLRQHLTCVQLSRELCDAHVEGDRIGSATLTFSPGELFPGDYDARIGSAGSANLVLQTALPALMTLDQNSSVRVTGGTHNGKSPPADFLRAAYLPLLEKIGPRCDLSLVRYGFYPAGGGELLLRINPRPVQGFRLVEREGRPNIKITAIVSKLPPAIAEREIQTILRKSNWKKPRTEIIEVSHPRGPGNAVLIEVGFENVTEVFMELGERGVSAEKVATRAWKQAQSYLDSNEPVGEFLADQLLMPLGIAASKGHSSQFKTGRLSLHATTHIDILQRFLDIQVSVQKMGESTLVSLVPNSDI